MSQFSCPIVPITFVKKHDNADTLSVTEIEGNPVIFKTGDFQIEQYAIYVPVDAVVPLSNPAFAFLATKEGQTHSRIKAKKLRGVFSMGLLVPLSVLPANHSFQLLNTTGISTAVTDVSEVLGITKYEEPEETLSTRSQHASRPPDTVTAPIYDIESHRKYRYLYLDGEEIVATEKLHGCNGRFVYYSGDEPTTWWQKLLFKIFGWKANARLLVGSRRFFNKESPTDIWWKVAKKYDLGKKLKNRPGFTLYGEVYGLVQDLHYGASAEDPVHFAAFDVLENATGRWLDYDEFLDFCKKLDIPTVPELYRGPYSFEKVHALSLGNSMLSSKQIREGVVIKPVKNRRDSRFGRVITKLVGEQYLLRKGGTEYH